MDDTLKQKLAKIYELVNRGATEGERQAAKKAMDRIMSKYSIPEEQITLIYYNTRRFTFSTELEVLLITQLVKFFIPDVFARAARGKRYISIKMNYEEWITLDCTYEYFRRHMKAQYNKVVLPELKRHRKASLKAKKRKLLEGPFFTKYAIKSGIVKPEDVVSYEIKEGTPEYYRANLMQSVEGGTYNKQMVSHLLLENK